MADATVLIWAFRNSEMRARHRGRVRASCGERGGCLVRDLFVRRNQLIVGIRDELAVFRRVEADDRKLDLVFDINVSGSS
jgi:hypothetical protein